jgi:hypothetical protein
MVFPQGGRLNPVTVKNDAALALQTFAGNPPVEMTSHRCGLSE